MLIRILPKELINQIAAGEVVERPVSVVKELIENSIDASAKNITVEIENGGINLVKIIDDGCGMSRGDANLCLFEHATSKINSVEDLYQIKTMGFRGEALPSIAAVSEFCLITKDKESVAGSRATVENGEIKVKDIGAADGTSVEVRNLFFNLPVRKKYLKTAVTEFNHIVDLFLDYCLAYSEISWKLVHNAKTVYQFPAAAQTVRIADCLGDDVASRLITVDSGREGVHLKGYVGLPAIARNNRKLQFLFVNRRPVGEYIISKQIKDAYGTLLARDAYPVYILDLEIDPQNIDVNVHPRKMEVRFSEPQAIYRAVYQIIAQTLDQNELERAMPAKELKNFVAINDVLQSKKKSASLPLSTKRFIANYPMSMELKQAAVHFNEALLKPETKKQAPAASAAHADYVSEFKVLGQVARAYIIVETEQSLKIYDQHACSERVQYEKLNREWRIGRLASQKLLLPQKIELIPVEAALMNDNAEALARLGFEIENFSGSSFAVSAVPRFLVDHDLRQLILQIVGEFTETLVVNDIIEGPIDAVLKMMACKSATKFGDELSFSGMEALIIDLEKSNNKYACVHGRPCVLEFKFSELEKMFKRK